MNSTLFMGTRIVVLALLSYTTAFFFLQKKKSVSNGVLVFQTLGISLDILATVLMILGSTNTPSTIHGFFGYSALTLMIVETVLIWSFRIKQDAKARLRGGLHTYSKIAYFWWVAAFVIGALFVILK